MTFSKILPVIVMFMLTHGVWGQQTILLADSGNDRIYSVPVSGSKAPTILLSNATGNNAGPTGIFFDPLNELLYINNGNERKSFVIGSDGVTPTFGPATFLPNSNPPTGEHHAIHVDVPNDRYFFSTDNANGVWVANTDGTGTAQQVITSGASIVNASGLTYDASSNTLYAVSVRSSAVVKVDVSSGESTLLYDENDGVTGPRGIRVDPSSGKLIWAQHTGGNGSGEIYVAQMDGTGTPSRLFEVPSPYLPYDVLFDQNTGTLYWSEFNRTNQSRVMKGSIDGTGSPEVLHLINTTGYLRGLAFGAVIKIPTMTEWGAFLFGLVIIAAGLVTLHQISKRSTSQLSESE